MDFRNQLGKIHSKYTSIAIANEIANDPKKFKNLMDIILANEDIISARAAWALSFSIEANPDLLTPYCSKIIQLILNKIIYLILCYIVYFLEMISYLKIQ